MNIELGCRNTPREGYDGVDMGNWGQKYKGDAETILKTFKDESVDKIYASHFFEHLYPDDIVTMIKQVRRVLKTGGQAWIIVPHKDHERANVIWHKSYWTEFTFKDMAEYFDFEIIELVTNERLDIHCKMIKENLKTIL